MHTKIILTAVVSYLIYYIYSFIFFVFAGQRPNQTTFKKDCPFFIKLTTTEDGSSLVVTDMCEDHNHEVHKNLFKFLPRQRHLSKEEKDEVEEMIRVNANKKLLQQHVMEKTGKTVILKDLHNITTEMKKTSKNCSDATKTDLERMQDIFLTAKNAQVEFLTEESQLKGIFFQDEEMKKAFEQYPEVILVDATYKINDLRMPLYLILSIDGNGQSEIVAIFLLTDEDETVLTSVVELFKTHNKRWQDISVVLTDKDMVERNVFRKTMPNAELQLCLFHVLRSFRREITTEKLGVTQGEKIRALELLLQMAYAKSVEEYDRNYDQLSSGSPSAVLSYFNRNWHPIRNQWVDGLKDGVNLGTRTNNRIESINSKVKSVLKHHSTLPEFAESILTALQSLRTERDHKTVNMFQKKSVKAYGKDSTEQKYQELLTPYAFDYVLRQLDNRGRVVLEADPDDPMNRWTSNTIEGSINVTLNKCSCSFNTRMLLPCKHIFKARELSQRDLFSIEDISSRWKIQSYTNHHRLFQMTDMTASRSNISPIPDRKKPLSQSVKFRKAQIITQKLAQLASETTGTIFTERIETLESLIQQWSQETPGSLVETNSVNEPMTHESTEMNENVDNENEQPTDTNVEVDHSESNHLVVHVSEQEWSEANEILEEASVPDTSNVETELKDVLLPPKLKKRGRPKGLTQTVVGLPKKRQCKNKALAFLQKPMKDRQHMVLEWFVGPDISTSALKDFQILTEIVVETDPNLVSSACMHKNVYIHIIRQFLDEDAWQCVISTYEQKLKIGLYTCFECKKSLATNEQSIMCDSCLEWNHYSCVRLRTAPKSKFWFCQTCRILNI